MHSEATSVEKRNYLKVWKSCECAESWRPIETDGIFFFGLGKPYLSDAEIQILRRTLPVCKDFYTDLSFNKQLLDEVEHDIMNYQNRGRLRQITQTRGFDDS